MSVKTVDKRFALIVNDGEIRFPYKTGQKSTGRYGFALTARGERNRNGLGTYTNDIEEVVRHLVFDGWKVRATTIDKVKKQNSGSTGVGLRGAAGYWIADELRHLVAGAKIAPSLLPGSSTSSGNDPSRNPTTHSTQSLPSLIVADSKTKHERGAIRDDAFDDDSADTSLLDDLDQIGSDADDSAPTERLDNRMSRIGQGKFRKNTIATWGGNERCAVTGIAVREVLTASHIIPWSEDVVQRKRGCNGILLTAHLDRLFDRHLIGFSASSEDGICSIAVAPRLIERFVNLAPLGVSGLTTLDLSKVKANDRSSLEKNLTVHLEIVRNNK